MLKTNILARIVALRKDCTVGISNSEKMIKSSEVMILSNKIMHMRLWFEEIREEGRKLGGEFIEIAEKIGDKWDDVSDLDIEGWMKNFKTEALLTP